MTADLVAALNRMSFESLTLEQFDALRKVATELASTHQCFHFVSAGVDGTRWCRACEALAVLAEALKDA